MTSLRTAVALAALLAACAGTALAQPRATDKPPSTAAAPDDADHKGMHKMTAKEREQHRKEMHDKMHADKAQGGKDADNCMGMMDKHKKMAKDHADDHTAAADDKARCGMGMGKKQ